MNDIEILQQMIKHNSLVKLENSSRRTRVKLTEPKRPQQSVTIHGLPENSVVIKVDDFKSPDSIFCNSKGECKRADYVIVTDTDNKKLILCIEMTETHKPKEEIIKQLKGARCFLAYCQEIGKNFWNHKDFLKGFNFRFISIAQISISKRPTKIDKQSIIHDKPEKMLRIRWPHHIEFNQIAGM